jgi:hypothetical protein
MFVTGEYLDAGATPEALRASTGILFIIAIGILLIIFQGFILTMSLDFAQKIGARLLLLNDDYYFKKDILKPAMIVGILVSCIICAINIIWPLELFSSLGEMAVFFNRTLGSLLLFVVYDINLLLFWMAGLALLIKKITKSDAMDLIVYTSIALVAFLGNMSSPIWHFGIMAFAIGPMVRCRIDVVLGVLFWKKGFETAVLCHFIIVLIFYLIAPMIMSAIAA